MIVLQLNDQNEAEVLIGLIHIAVQARGLDAAEAGIVLAKRIKDAIEASKAPADMDAGDPKISKIKREEK